MATGVVKWFNFSSGYGYVVPDDGGDELFVHRASIVGEDGAPLTEGERVSFDSHVGGMGPAAMDVRRLGTL